MAAYHVFKNDNPEPVARFDNSGKFDAVNAVFWDSQIVPPGRMHFPESATVRETDDGLEVTLTNGDIYRSVYQRPQDRGNQE